MTAKALLKVYLRGAKLVAPTAIGAGLGGVSGALIGGSVQSSGALPGYLIGTGTGAAIGTAVQIALLRKAGRKQLKKIRLQQGTGTLTEQDKRNLAVLEQFEQGRELGK
jgi:outer membrane lipoprotein SlyB